MSLITRCPACTTMFKVVPDQLRVSEGWVRCGQCNEVFDANVHLQTDGLGGLKPPVQEQTDQDIWELPAVPGPASQAVTTASTTSTPGAASTPEAHAANEAPIADRFLEVNPHALHIEPQEVTDNSDGLWAPGEQWEQPDPSAAPPHVRHSDPVDAVEDDGPQHSFMRVADAPSGWSRTPVRLALLLLGLLLCMTLALQIVVRERDRIAATEPDAKRLLEPLCAFLGCTISPFRQIESVVIDSSSFAKVQSDVYRLSFTLKNTAPTALATPSVELTLTDMQDQTVVRRVFVAGDFADKHMVMEPGSEVLASLPVAVKLSGNGERISGYRLLSFYP